VVPSEIGPFRSVHAETATVASFGNWPIEAHDIERTGYDSAERTLNVSNVSQLERIWSDQLPGHVLASPIVVNGSVYVGDADGSLYALNASNGQVLWKTDLGGDADLTGCRGLTGIANTPTYWNGTLYVGGGNPSLYAVNSTTGGIEWSVDIANESAGAWWAIYNWASTLVYNGSAYVGVASGCDNPMVAGQVLRINLHGSTHTIQAVWSATSESVQGGAVWRGVSADPRNGDIYVTDGNENSSCNCASSMVYTRALVALNSTSLDLLGYRQLGMAGCDCDMGTSPLVANMPGNKTLLYAVNKDGEAYLFRPGNLTLSGTNSSLASFDVASEQIGVRARTGAAFNGTTAYIGGGPTELKNGTSCAGSIDAMDLGGPLTPWPAFDWQYCAPGDEQAGISVANGLIAAFLLNTPEWTTDEFEVLSAATGKVLYSTPVNQSVFSGAAIGDGRIYFGTTNGSTFAGDGYVDAYGLPLSIALNASTADSDGQALLNVTGAGGAPPYRCAWVFGDGGTGTGCDVIKQYARAGTYSVEVTVTDADGDVASAASQVTVIGVQPTIQSANADPTSLDVGHTTTFTILASGTDGPLTYSYEGLPAGCASANTSVLSCTPSRAGPSTVLVSVADILGYSASAAVPVEVNDLPSIQLMSIFPATIPIGAGALISLDIEGGTAPFRYAYSGLPFGCGSANASSISCHPQGTGTFAIGAEVTDADDQSANSSLVLEVTANASSTPPPLVGTALSVFPDNISLGNSVSVTAIAGGGAPPYSYAYTGLPSGCRPANVSVLVCTPTASGRFPIYVVISDAAGQSLQLESNLTVSPAAVPTPAAGTTSSTVDLALAIALVAIPVALLLGWLLARRRPPARPPVAAYRKSNTGSTSAGPKRSGNG
jgi:outer membrane protein assembly factor BamB